MDISSPREEFGLEVEKRFRETEVDEVVEQMAQLKQTSTVLHYREQFEEIKLKMERINPELTGVYHTECFIARLKHESFRTRRGVFCY